MKRPGICLSIVTILATCLLAACTPGGSTSSKKKCSTGGEVCINTSTVQTFSMGDQFALNITVTSSKDISDLHVTLSTSAEVTVDGPQSWENYLSSSSIEPGYAGWNFAIKGGQPLPFNRVLHFPSNEGYFQVITEVFTPLRNLVAIDNFYVHLTHDGGKVIMAGTPFPPYTPNFTPAAYGPGTPVPTNLLASPLPWMTIPSPTQFVPLVATSTLLTSPYPPPPPSPSPYP